MDRLTLSITQAVKQITTSLRPYNAVQRISQIWRRVQEMQGELRSKIDADWDKLCVDYVHRV